MDNKKRILFSVLGILGLIIITGGVTYAFFNYAKEGSTDNTLTTGSITFTYEEVDKQGAGISITDAFPMEDGNGKIQEGTGKVFNFKVASTTQTNEAIPYIITVRKSETSTLNNDAVRVYLTEGTTDETQLVLENYGSLDDYEKAREGITEKILYSTEVPAGEATYEKNYKLRMWIASDANFNDATVNGQTMTLTVNVYANTKGVGNTVKAEQTTYTNENTECTDINCSLNELYDLTK